MCQNTAATDGMLGDYTSSLLYMTGHEHAWLLKACCLLHGVVLHPVGLTACMSSIALVYWYRHSYSR